MFQRFDFLGRCTKILLCFLMLEEKPFEFLLNLMQVEQEQLVLLALFLHLQVEPGNLGFGRLLLFPKLLFQGLPG